MSNHITTTGGKDIVAEPAKKLTGAIVVKDQPLALPLQEGIMDLIAASPTAASAVSGPSGTRTLKIYKRALEGFHDVLAAYVLEELLWNNPRNPFVPSPQDVRDRCKQVEAEWEKRVWGQVFSSEVKADDVPDVPDVIVLRVLRRDIPGLLKPRPEEPGGYSHISAWDLKSLDLIPAEAWADGERELAEQQIKARIQWEADFEARRAREKAEEEREAALMDALTGEERSRLMGIPKTENGKKIPLERRIEMVKAQIEDVRKQYADMPYF